MVSLAPQPFTPQVQKLIQLQKEEDIKDADKSDTTFSAGSLRCVRLHDCRGRHRHRLQQSPYRPVVEPKLPSPPPDNPMLAGWLAG